MPRSPLTRFAVAASTEDAEASLDLFRAELAKLGDEDAVFAAARAVVRHDEDVAAYELLGQLTPREQTIAYLAWQHGRGEALETARELIGPTAATIDAAAFRERLGRIPTAPKFREQEPRSIHFVDRRALDLLASVLDVEQAEAEVQAQAERGRAA